jgi:hypothetical protein
LFLIQINFPSDAPAFAPRAVAAWKNNLCRAELSCWKQRKNSFPPHRVAWKKCTWRCDLQLAAVPRAASEIAQLDDSGRINCAAANVARPLLMKG